MSTAKILEDDRSVSPSEQKKIESIRVYHGTLIHSISTENPLQIVENGLIGVQNGKIIFVDTAANFRMLKKKYLFKKKNMLKLGQYEFLVPGFIDTHIHAPQYPNSGLGLDLPLLEWLETYTYPLESKFENKEFARNCYKKVVERTLRNGTTTASYFCTIHPESSEIMGEIVEELGQRAFIGKVAMDSNSPEYYVKTTEQSLASTEEFVINILKRNDRRVRPTITPRFALTCSERLMRGLGIIAKKYDIHIQTHLCESEPEIKRALELFPDYKTYTGIYEGMGLLTEKSIMAHCVYMKKEELSILARHLTGVAHCPLSNICVLSGLCPVRKLIAAGIAVGLGTDVSGGYSPSILESMRQAILTSKVVAMKDKNYKELDFKEVFYLATMGGARALAIEKEVGNFEVGKYFDALHVDLISVGSPINLFPGEPLTISQMFQKFVMLGDDRNIKQVFVEGRKIKLESETV